MTLSKPKINTFINSSNIRDVSLERIVLSNSPINNAKLLSHLPPIERKEFLK